MQSADLEGIAAIERESPSPWKHDLISREIHQADGVRLVAEDTEGGLILGWCCGRQIGPEAELLKISVLLAKRKCGIASELLVRLVQEFTVRGVNSLFLEVRAGNFPALQLYRKHGFNEIGRRKRYYCDPEEDALVLTKDLRKC